MRADAAREVGSWIEKINNKKVKTDAAREVGSWIENCWPFGLWLAGLVLLLEEYKHTHKLSLSLSLALSLARSLARSLSLSLFLVGCICIGRGEASVASCTQNDTTHHTIKLQPSTALLYNSDHTYYVTPDAMNQS